MTQATKTVNPLHFEDLEPKRFEDLVRQLIYDFRSWSALEATGRSGGDDGFDVRGIEAVLPEAVDDSESDEYEIPPDKPRVWLIQCKREKSITPTRMKEHLEAISKHEIENIDGLLFVAACDLSKTTRDTFHEWCVAAGVAEHHVWGRGELEDLLFNPKNDHLLFAYFGLSLQIKKRSLRTSLRGRLAVKRQAIRHLGNIGARDMKPVLLRDASAESYPYSGEIPDFDKKPLWRTYICIGHYYGGLKFLVKEHFAYLADDGRAWDIEERIRRGQPYENPWPIKNEKELENVAHRFWGRLPDKNRATMELVGLVPYEEVLAIDEAGDEYFQHPHIFVQFREPRGPFLGGFYPKLVTYNPSRQAHKFREEDRIKFFPETYPSEPAGNQAANFTE